ncbi:response regulator [Pelagicoccus sp. SDUM812003]|uniref:response regulator n=1 Tax=Pelagicoccus sp. SDUM812003 TaxID=3041267 RepID=UPI00280FDEE0|nr:response regulator [Pelagicoccus sp. SDUM812003]MDQ8204346.1 response regulator [Pelagicoccus sp. SDUM812003]
MAKTIISIDDSLSVRETVRMTLRSQGYDVVVAEDGIKGFEACQQRKADLVITDLNMPNLDGIGLIAKLRQLPNYRFTPILMLTTESDEQKKLAGKRAGATGWIVKPFKTEKFLAVVNKVCASR